MTKYTELGDNSTIKSPPPLESNRSARRRNQKGPQTYVYPRRQLTPSTNIELVRPQMLLCLMILRQLESHPPFQ